MPNDLSDLFPHLPSVHSWCDFNGRKSESQAGKRCINKWGGKVPAKARGKTELLKDLCVYGFNCNKVE